MYVHTTFYVGLIGGKLIIWQTNKTFVFHISNLAVEISGHLTSVNITGNSIKDISRFHDFARGTVSIREVQCGFFFQIH